MTIRHFHSERRPAFVLQNYCGKPYGEVAAIVGTPGDEQANNKFEGVPGVMESVGVNFALSLRNSLR